MPVPARPELSAAVGSDPARLRAVAALAWAATLRKYLASDDIVFGVGDKAGFDDDESHVLPLRVCLSDEMPATDALAIVAAGLDAIAAPPQGLAALDDIAAWSGLSELNTVLTFGPISGPVDRSRYGATLAVNISIEDGELAITAVHDSSIDDTLTLLVIHEFDTALCRIAAALTAEPAQLAPAPLSLAPPAPAEPHTLAVADLSALSSEHAAQVAQFGNGERVPLPYDIVHHGFQIRAKKHPEWRAVEHGPHSLTYGQLDARASLLASQLAVLGICVGSSVALIMGPSLELPVAMLAVLKTGAAIVPLDASMPIADMQFIIQDAAVSIVLSTENLRACLARLALDAIPVVWVDAHNIRIDEDLVIPKNEYKAHGDEPFIIVYDVDPDSGALLGVPVLHVGATNVIWNMTPAMGVFEHSRLLVNLPVCSDVSSWGIWGALTHGAVVVLPGSSGSDFVRCAAKADVLLTSPSELAILGDPERVPNLRHVTLVGEPCPIALKNSWAARASFSCAWGPTETSIISHLALLSPDDSVVAGRPVSNIRAFILDSQLRQLPIGVIGELYIGGIAVSSGYINAPAAAAERFLPDALVPGGRMFRTGDLARLLPSGDFEIVGSARASVSSYVLKSFGSLRTKSSFSRKPQVSVAVTNGVAKQIQSTTTVSTTGTATTRTTITTTTTTTTTKKSGAQTTTETTTTTSKSAAQSPLKIRTDMTRVFDKAEISATRAAAAQIVIPGLGLSYEKLDDRSGALAAQLLLHGVRKNVRVAVVMHRSVETHIALLAVFKLGAAAVPIDASLPAELIQAIVIDAGVSIVLSTEAERSVISSLTLTTVPVVWVDSEQLARSKAIFTASESTGPAGTDSFRVALEAVAHQIDAVWPESTDFDAANSSDDVEFIASREIKTSAADKQTEPAASIEQAADEQVAKEIVIDEQLEATFEQIMSLADLDVRSNALAAQLDAHGVGKGVRVAVVMGRRVEAFISLMALFKRGAAAVPVDALLGPDLVQAIVADAGVSVVLSTKLDRAVISSLSLSTVPVVWIDSELLAESKAVLKPVTNVGAAGTTSFRVAYEAVVHQIMFAWSSSLSGAQDYEALFGAAIAKDTVAETPKPSESTFTFPASAQDKLLDTRSGALAVQLAIHGVRKSVRVAVVMRRSVETHIALLAVFKLGAAAVPIDASLPAELIQAIVVDAGVSIVLSTEAERDVISSLTLTTVPVVWVDSEQLARSTAVFTASESTGPAGTDSFRVALEAVAHQIDAVWPESAAAEAIDVVADPNINTDANGGVARKRWTKKQLDSNSRALAAQLAIHGVRKGVRVAVVMRRSVETHMALLAVFKLGAAAVPIDASLPAELIQAIVVDAGVSIVLSTEAERDVISSLTLTTVPIVWVDSEQLARSTAVFAASTSSFKVAFEAVTHQIDAVWPESATADIIDVTDDVEQAADEQVAKEIVIDEQLEATFEQIMSLADLDVRSNALAAQLDALGVGKGVRVAVVMGRRVEAFISLMALFKRGAAAVPVDALLGPDLVQAIVADAGVSVVLSTKLDRAVISSLSLSTVPVVWIDSELLAESKAVLKPVTNVGAAGTTSFRVAFAAICDQINSVWTPSSTPAEPSSIFAKLIASMEENPAADINRVIKALENMGGDGAPRVVGTAAVDIATEEADELSATVDFGSQRTTFRVVSTASDAVAVDNLTQKQLDDRSGALAAQLAIHGVRKSVRVAVVMRRSVETHIALLAVFKLGAAAVPIDASLPAELIQAIVVDAGVSIVLSTEAERDVISSLTLTTAPIVWVDSEQLARSTAVFAASTSSFKVAFEAVTHQIDAVWPESATADIVDAIEAADDIEVAGSREIETTNQVEQVTIDEVFDGMFDSTLSYSDLDSRSGALAVQLAIHGVRKSVRVAVVMRRCVETHIALLAVFKLGAAAVPIDSSVPVDQIQAIVVDAGVSIVLSTEAERDVISSLSLTTVPVVWVDSEQLARSTAVFKPVSRVGPAGTDSFRAALNSVSNQADAVWAFSSSAVASFVTTAISKVANLVAALDITGPSSPERVLEDVIASIEHDDAPGFAAVQRIVARDVKEAAAAFGSLSEAETLPPVQALEKLESIKTTATRKISSAIATIVQNQSTHGVKTVETLKSIQTRIEQEIREAVEMITTNVIAHAATRIHGTQPEVSEDTGATSLRTIHGSASVLEDIVAEFEENEISDIIDGITSGERTPKDKDDGAESFATLRSREPTLVMPSGSTDAAAKMSSVTEDIIAAFESKAEAVQSVRPLVAAIGAEAVDEIFEVWARQMRLFYGGFVALPPTPVQRAMVEATIADSSAYVAQIVLRVAPKVDEEKLHAAFVKLVQHHDILRAAFVRTEAAGIVQVIRHEPHDVVLFRTPLALDDFLDRDKARGFMLGDKNWIRLSLVSGAAPGEDHHVVLTLHHALYDGLSLPVITGDLVNAYQDLPLASRPSFRAVIDHIGSQNADAVEAFWREHLAGIAPATPLALGHAVMSDDEDLPVVVSCSLDMEDINTAAERAGVTPEVLLKTAWALALRKYTRSNDVVFGQVVSGRSIAVPDAMSIVGPVHNIIPVRFQFDDSVPVGGFIKAAQVQHDVTQPYAHTGLDEIKAWCGLPPTAKVFNTLFMFEQAFTPEGDEQDVSELLQENSTTNLSPTQLSSSIEIVLFEGPTELQISLAYNKTDMTRTQALLALYEFDMAIVELSQDTTLDSNIEQFWSLTPEHMAQIEQYGLGERVDVASELVHVAFERRAAETPEAVAVEHGSRRLTFGELDSRACALAAQLDLLGAAKGSRVAVVMQAGVELVVSLVAVLKTGATAVPLDSRFPAQWLQFALADVGVAAVLSAAAERERISQLSLGTLPVLWVDADLLGESDAVFVAGSRHAATGRDAFAILYSSGSSGQPAGVALSHVGGANIVANSAAKLGLAPGVRTSHVQPIESGAGQWEIWCSLGSGATLVVGDGNAAQVARSVNVLFATAETLERIGSPLDFGNLRVVNVFGEGISARAKDQWASCLTLNGVHVPSEMPLITHIAQLTAAATGNIGRPVANTSSFVLDAAMQPVPIGVVGDIFVGGVGVVPGFINHEKLNSERFFPDPTMFDGYVFKTGDQGRLLPTGAFELLALREDKIDLKDMSIEVEDIAAALLTYPGVKSAVVVFNNSIQQLAGFVDAADASVDSIRSYVAGILPAYMVPAVIVGLESLPTDATGKPDLEVLAALDLTTKSADAFALAARRMAEIWAGVFGIPAESIQRDTNFFELGGNLLSAIPIADQCERESMDIRAADLFLHPVFAAIVAKAAGISHAAPRITVSAFAASDAATSSTAASAIAVTAEAFWSKHLAGITAAKPLSLGHAVMTNDESVPVVVDATIGMDVVAEAAKRAGVTAETLLRTAWALALRKYTRSNDIVFGEVVQGHQIRMPDPSLEFDPLLHTFACRVQLEDSATVAETLKRVQVEHNQVMAHAYASLVDVRRWSGLVDDDKLFTTLLMITAKDTDADADDWSFASEQSVRALFDTLESSFGLLLTHSDKELKFALMFNNADMTRTQALLALYEFDMAIVELSQDTTLDSNIEQFWSLTPEHMAQIEQYGLGERVDVASELVHVAFERRAAETPEAVAVEHGSRRLTFGELDSRACALAAQLDLLGAAKGSRVAVVMQAGVELVVSLVAVLKTGATAVPLDSRFPAQWLQFALADVGVAAVLSAAAERERISQLSLGTLPVLWVDADLLGESDAVFVAGSRHAATGRDAFAILYSSGSSGQPAGVALSHVGGANIVANSAAKLGLAPGVRTSHVQPIESGAGQWEIWCSLGSGATLVVGDGNAAQVARSVNVLFATAETLERIGSPLDFGNLRVVNVFGEGISARAKDQWASCLTLNGVHVPSEMPLITHIAQLTAAATGNIGRPVANTSSFVLDAAMQPVPIGVVGDIFVGGVGVVPGFVNHEKLNSERFFPDPTMFDGYVFKTGDQGRLLPTGVFEVKGMYKPAAERSHLSNKRRSMMSFRISANSGPTYGSFDSAFEAARRVLAIVHEQPVIKIVCFHGQGSNTSHMEHQLSAIKSALGERVEFVFIQAFKQIDWSPQGRRYGDMPWFEWFSSRDVVASNVDVAVSFAKDMLDVHGRVDAILGFSQGAMLVELLDRLSLQGKIKRTWKFSVLMSGLPLSLSTLPARLAEPMPAPMPFPSIHAYGKDEPEEVRTALSSRYQAFARAEFVHDAGHDIPRDVEFGRAVGEAIAAFAASETVTGRFRAAATESASASQPSAAHQSLVQNLFNCYTLQ
ncbi:hypothetical protein HK105_201025 [Polyrhizophydium stewartii]|uniref:Carrier domain-containing protein n=1 Tax=Polyrhizophydium stewartii TaxID=2732419 RepID=A0ABR4NIU3_9FUNG